MRDRHKTIESLRRLAERPGSPAEGETARRKLRELEAKQPKAAAAPAPNFERMRYVQYQGEFDIDYLREILGVKRATRPKQKPTIIREDMEGMIRRSIFRNTPDPD